MLNECYITSLPKIGDSRGDLSFIQKSDSVPFNIKRLYYLSNISDDQSRGLHAHKHMSALMIAISGCFDVTLDDAYNRKSYTLNSRFEGLFIAPGMWRELNNFSSDAVCLVVASTIYSEEDYIRDYDEFLSWKRENK
jgi:dTDP-4-dehydrorhamnose 3,5-epimerase-like enzyme